ncbi:MAG: hypothetical protein K0S27_891 [Gammaproteobacteria bacterium]|jgi:regulator of replication initiation timing|nr:hypothetical protein [Gammaproteobacteria bacterium]
MLAITIVRLYYFLGFKMNDHELRECIMTDDFLKKLEEKVMALLTELEDLRFDVQQLKQENSDLKVEKLHYTQRLQGLISLLDSIDAEMEVSAAFPAHTDELEAI